MPRFADLPLSSFLDALSSSEPTPGGGTAAAVSGAIGTSLLMMVAGLDKTRTGSDAERVKLSEARAGLTSIRQRLLTLADTDSEAYDHVVAAYRLPKTTEIEKTARKEAVRRAMRGAAEAPLDTLRATCEAGRHAKVVAQHGNPSAASDVRVALELLEASAAGAVANIEINLASLDDERYQEATAATMLDLTNRLTETLAAARSALNAPK